MVLVVWPIGIRANLLLVVVFAVLANQALLASTLCSSASRKHCAHKSESLGRRT